VEGLATQPRPSNARAGVPRVRPQGRPKGGRSGRTRT
jgi:hypothetical protein